MRREPGACIERVSGGLRARCHEAPERLELGRSMAARVTSVSLTTAFTRAAIVVPQRNAAFVPARERLWCESSQEKERLKKLERSCATRAWARPN